MAEFPSKLQTLPYRVFKRNYATLGECFCQSLPVVASELYSSELISQVTKDRATSDTTTHTQDRAFDVLNDIEGKLKSSSISEHAFEELLRVLCSPRVDLSHIAEPMRTMHQKMSGNRPKLTDDHCDSEIKMDLVTGTSCFVGPNVAYAHDRSAGNNLEGPTLTTPQESRPKHLSLSYFPSLAGSEHTAGGLSPKHVISGTEQATQEHTNHHKEDLKLSVEAFC